MREVGLTFIGRRVDTEELARELEVKGKYPRPGGAGVGGIRTEGVGVPRPHRVLSLGRVIWRGAFNGSVWT